MRSRFRAALLVVICALAAQAQPTITSNDIPTNPGTTIHFASSATLDTVNLGGSGGNQTWNFSSISATQNYTENWVQPSATPFGSQFTNANRAADVVFSASNNHTYNYYNQTPSALTLIGFGFTGTDCTYSVVYSSPMPLYNFPISFAQQWNTVFSYSVIQGFDTRDSTHSVADAWGTLTDGTGTYTALRIQSHHFIITTFIGLPPDTLSHWIYTWLVPGRGPQVTITSDANQPNPNFTLGEFSHILTVTGVIPLPEPAVMPSQMELGSAYPNPFNSSTVLTFTLPQSGDISLSVFDAAGREVANLTQGHYLPGAYQVSFDGTGLPSGTYYARLTDGDNTRTSKLVLLK